MRVASDSFIMVIAFLVLIGAGVTVATVFSDADSRQFKSDETALSTTDIEATEARRNSGPNREVTERPVALIEEKEASPLVMPQAGEGLIIGVVVDHEDQPVVAATVSCDLYFPIGELNYSLVDSFHLEVETDEQGRFGLTAPSQGFYRVMVRHELHAPKLQDKITVGADLKFQMDQAAGLMGYVRGSEGQAIPGAKISLRQEEGFWRETTVADGDGRYGLPGLPAGKIIVDVTAAEHLRIDDEVLELTGAEILERDFILGTGRAIAGTIIDDQDLRIRQATVKVNGQKVISDDIGRFRIGGLSQSSHSVEVIADGYLTHWQNINLSGSRAEAQVEFKLSRGGTVTGMVFDDTGKPVAEAEIKVFQTWGDGDHMWDTGETRYLTTTDENGNYRIDGLVAERWTSHRARAAKEGFAHAFSDTFKIESKEQPAQINIVIRPGGEVAGTVRDESGRPIAGVKMSLNRNNVHEWSGKHLGRATCLSDEKGEYRFDRLSAGQYRVSAMALGYATVYKSGIEVVGAGAAEGQDLIMKEGGVVKGSIKTPEGTPIPGATVQLNSSSSWGMGQSDEQGEYVIRNVGEGPYWVSAYSAGYSRERKNKVFATDGRIDFELRRDGYVWGQVVEGEDDQPVRQFRVALLQQESRNGGAQWQQKAQTWVNNPEGKFKLYAPDGTYKLVITASGYIKKEVDNIALSVDAEPDEMKVKVVPGGAIEGWVRNFDGNPVPWVQIYCRNSQDGKWQRRTHTEQDGYYYLDSLEAGSYELAFDRRGLMPLGYREFINVSGGDIVRADYSQLAQTQVLFRHLMPEDPKDSPSWFQVRVTSVDGSPLTMHSTGWSREGNNLNMMPFITYQIRRGQSTWARELPPGEYEVEIKSKGFEDIRQILMIKANDDLEFVIDLKREKKDKAD